MKNIQALVITLSLLVFGKMTQAEMPRQFYFEDYYTTTNGPYTGSVELQLQIFSDPTNGVYLYEDSNTVEVVDGFYATLIGDNTVYGSLTNALIGGQAYVQVVINGTPFTPREPLVPVPYALNTASVASNAITASMLVNGSITTNKLASEVDARYLRLTGGTIEGQVTNLDWFYIGDQTLDGSQPGRLWLRNNDAERWNQIFFDSYGFAVGDTNDDPFYLTDLNGNIGLDRLTNALESGEARFVGDGAGLRVPPQGDISMGSYTNGTF